MIANSKRYPRFRFYLPSSPGQPATEMSNSPGRLVFASPTADTRAPDIKIKRHRRRWIDTQDYETSKLLKPLISGVGPASLASALGCRWGGLPPVACNLLTQNVFGPAGGPCRLRAAGMLALRPHQRGLANHVASRQGQRTAVSGGGCWRRRHGQQSCPCHQRASWGRTGWNRRYRSASSAEHFAQSELQGF